jgi:hypothetical protein
VEVIIHHAHVDNAERVLVFCAPYGVEKHELHVRLAEDELAPVCPSYDVVDPADA